MKLFHDTIQIKKNLLLPEGTVDIPQNRLGLIQGENGSGKTLLLKNIFLHEKNKDTNPFLIDQNNNVFIPKIDVLHNISMNTDETRNQEIKKQLETWGLGYLVMLNPQKLSGGEKRIVNILRGIFSGASLLILDEPTNDLDYITVSKKIQLFQMQKENRTLLVVSHDDRLREIADVIIRLTDKQLVTEKKTEDNCIQTDSSECRQFDLSMTRQVFSYNWVQFLVGVLFVLLLCMQIRSYKSGMDLRDLHTPPNQINLYMPISVSLNGDDSLSCCPLGLINLLHTNNPIKQVHAYSEMDQIMTSRSFDIHALENIKSTADYTVYPLEFYDPTEKRTVFSLDVYLQQAYGTSLDISEVDTSAFFVQPYKYAYEIQRTYTLDPVKFQQTTDELLKDKNLYPVSVVIRLNDDGSAFYRSSACETLAKANIYACSEDIRQSVASLRELHTILDMSMTLLAGAALLFAVNFMFNLLYWKNQKNSIAVIRNYGYQEKSVIDGIVQKTNNRFPLLLLLLFVIIYNVAAFMHIHFRQCFFVFSIYGVIFFSGLYALNNFAAERTVNRMYRWDER